MIDGEQEVFIFCATSSASDALSNVVVSGASDSSSTVAVGRLDEFREHMLAPVNIIRRTPALGMSGPFHVQWEAAGDVFIVVDPVRNLGLEGDWDRTELLVLGAMLVLSVALSVRTFRWE